MAPQEVILSQVFGQLAGEVGHAGLAQSETFAAPKEEMGIGVVGPDRRVLDQPIIDFLDKPSQQIPEGPSLGSVGIRSLPKLQGGVFSADIRLGHEPCSVDVMLSVRGRFGVDGVAHQRELQRLPVEGPPDTRLPPQLPVRPERHARYRANGLGGFDAARKRAIEGLGAPRLDSCFGFAHLASPCILRRMAPWHNWIARVPPKDEVAGSNPAGVTTFLTIGVSRPVVTTDLPQSGWTSRESLVLLGS